MNNYKFLVKGIFDRASTDYGENGCSFFDHFGKGLVDLAPPLPGETILDVATGKGAVLLPAAKKIGKSGSAIGIDLSAKMIEEAKKKISLPWVSWEEMDAEQLTFQDQMFDKVFCAFGLFFFPHIEKALSEFHRVLKKNGVLAVSTFGKKSALDEWLSNEIKQLGPYEKLAAWKLDTPALLQEHLMKAGFSKIEIYQESKICLYETGENWWNSLWTRASRFQLEQIPSEQLETLKQKALLFTGNSVQEERTVIYGVAH